MDGEATKTFLMVVVTELSNHMCVNRDIADITYIRTDKHQICI